MNSGCVVVLKRDCDGSRAEWCLRCRLIVREKQLLYGLHIPTGYSCWWGWAGEALQRCHDESECPKEPDPVDWTFRRGFVHALTLTAADCLAHLDAIRAAAPVQAVTLTTWPECMQPHGFRNPCRRFDETARIFPWCDACRLTAEESRAKRWPGITFTLPPVATVAINGQTFDAVSYQVTAYDAAGNEVPHGP